MEVLDVVAKLVSIGAGVKGIFDSAPSLEDIAGAVRDEVAAVFFDAQVEQATIDAVAALQTARDYFAINYASDQAAGLGPAALWNDLNTSSALNGLDIAANTVNGWLAAADDQPAPKDKISTEMSTSLGIYLHMCLQYRERAAVAGSPEQQAAELGKMRGYARTALTNLQSRVMTRIATRLSCLSYTSGQKPLPPTSAVPSSMGMGFSLQSFAIISDTWFDGGWSSLQANLPYPQYPQSQVAAIMQRVLYAYRRLLWSGWAEDYNELVAALNDPAMGAFIGSGRDYTWRDQFITNSLPGVLAFGKWAASARSAMSSLDAMATGFPGGAQDNWHQCAQCSGLYYGTRFPDDGTKRCPAGGQHVNTDNTDYALYVLPGPGAVPAGTQSGWCWCIQCDVLFYSPDPSVCPTGGAHVSSGSGGTSGNYVLRVGDAAPLNTGMKTAPGWLWCNPCGALHFAPSSTSVCPATNGPHHNTGGNYWLSNVGTWPGP